MGGFVSRRKRSKVEARSVSTQATESRKAGTDELHVECRAEVATGVHETQKAVTALSIGDGHQLGPGLQQHQYTISKRASSENKKRRGLSNVKPDRPRSGSKKGATHGVDFSTQYDFIGLPGQVSSGFRSPPKANKAENTTTDKHTGYPPKEAHHDPEKSIDNIGPEKLAYATAKPKEPTTVVTKRAQKSPRAKTPQRSPRTKAVNEEQERSQQKPRSPRTQRSPRIKTVNEEQEISQQNPRSPITQRSPRTKPVNEAQENNKKNSRSPRDVTVVPANWPDTRDREITEQDENFNILKEGTLLAELRIRDMFGACSDDELGTALRHLCDDNFQPQLRPASVLSQDVERSERRSLLADLSPRRLRKKTVTYSDDCKPAPLDPRPSSTVSDYLSDERQPEFRQSLEQIFQDNVPCHGEALEVAAVTGTGSARITLPPPEGYHACWNNVEAYRYCEHYTGTAAPIEAGFYNPPIEYMDADPAFGGKLKGVKMATEEIAAQHHERVCYEVEDEEEEGCQVDEDMAEDTLDWNVDDRVRSPSETRTDRVILTDDDDDDDNMDMLGDCSIDSVPTTHGQRQSSLTTLKDGDSGRGSIYRSLTQTSPPAETLERVETETTQNASQPCNRNNTLSPSKDPANTNVVQPETGKALQNDTSKILMQIGKKPNTGEQKSFLEIQETEAMTLLLLTGSLPGEEVGGGVTRGAGDAQRQALDHTAGTTTTDTQTDENQEADERAGLASMLDTQSKTSCQLEQLQSQTGNTQNSVGHSDAVPPQNEKTNEGDSSAAGGASTTSRLENNALGIPDRDGRSAPSSVATSTNRYRISHNTATDGAAAAALTETRVEEFQPQLKGPASSGAASSESEWEVIPVRRVPGQTSLSGSAASGACTTLEAADTTLSQVNAQAEQAGDQQMIPPMDGSQVTSAQPSTQPQADNGGVSAGDSQHGQDNIGESQKSE